MIHKPYRLRDMDDDYAPIDYNYMPSVNEGRRLEQQRNIKKEPERAVLRHRVDPFERERVDAYGTRASLAPRSTVAGKLPSIKDGPAPATSIAYPQGMDIPDNPFDPPAEESRPTRQGRRRSAAPAPAPIVTEDGSQFEPPALAELPEWYRVAQQNSMPRDDRRGPRVQAAPRYDDLEPEEPARDVLGRPLRSPQAIEVKKEYTPAALYEDAGYPEELLTEQQRYDEEMNRVARRRHHGAQAVVNRKRQEEYERSQAQKVQQAAAERDSYPPSREEYARRRALSQEERESRLQAVNRVQQAAGQPVGRRAAYQAAVYDEETAVDPRAAYNPYARQQPVTQPVAAAAQDAVAYEEEEVPRRFSIPWPGIAVFAMAAIAVALWLMQLNFTSRTEDILAQRQLSYDTVKSAHPYDYRALIEREAAKNNLNPAFVAAIVLNESSFRPDAESNVGARGLMQVMEETAAEIGDDLRVSNYSFDMLYDAETNVTFGCYYLGKLSQRFRGDPVLVSAAYHAGATQVQNWLNTSTYSTDGVTLILDNMTDGPTKQYATRVKRDFAVYKRLYYENVEDDG